MGKIAITITNGPKRGRVVQAQSELVKPSSAAGPCWACNDYWPRESYAKYAEGEYLVHTESDGSRYVHMTCATVGPRRTEVIREEIMARALLVYPEGVSIKDVAESVPDAKLSDVSGLLDEGKLLLDGGLLKAPRKECDSYRTITDYGSEVTIGSCLLQRETLGAYTVCKTDDECRTHIGIIMPDQTDPDRIVAICYSRSGHLRYAIVYPQGRLRQAVNRIRKEWMK